MQVLDPIAQIRQALYTKMNAGKGVLDLSSDEQQLLIALDTNDKTGNLCSTMQTFKGICPVWTPQGNSNNVTSRTRREKVVQVILPTGFGVGLLAALLQLIEAIKS